ncbi:MAG: aminopeptidase P family protein [Alphaproteobacteria bacterium]|nr:aminopeptidase P family protein [Alphaproteobacteria bacterium]
MEKTSAEKLSALRALISQAGLDGLIIPHTDEYRNEYLPPESKRLEWLTGFTGSAGYAVVLTDKAVAASDGRYYPIQIKAQVDETQFKAADSTKISDVEWLLAHAPQGAKIGFDPKLTSPAQYEKMKARLADKGIELVPTPENLVDKAWGADRPATAGGSVEVFSAALDGQESSKKIAALSKTYSEKGADYAVITLPDSIAWLLNIRGNDVECNPYVLSTAMLDVKTGAVEWFLDTAKIDPADQALADHLKHVSCRPSGELSVRLDELAKSGKTVALDYKTASLWYKNKLGEVSLDVADIASNIKAHKTPHQVAMIKRTQVEDGVAMVKFLRWVEENAPSGQLTEMDLAAQLEVFRGQSPTYRGPSFGAIVGAAGNGAIVHYHATPESNRKINPGDMVLVDSGGQYCGADFAGTTDITRTIVAGTPTVQMKHDYTRVLQAHIAVAASLFAADETGQDVDKRARDKLKPHGLDYAHGTGHGVGQYLSVHEESPRISTKEDRPLTPGLHLSNEPGYYAEGSHGIRSENLVIVNEPDADGNLSFETVTYAPFEPSLVDFDLLDQAEKNWLADYHKFVFQALENHPGLD